MRQSSAAFHPATTGRSGIALIIVLVIIVALGILAGGFAYTMKVETKLARNASFDVEFEWAARAGIEHAKYVLGEDMKGPTAAWDTLNEKWAGGTGSTNDPLGELPMTDIEVGPAIIDVKIEDNDRKFNINAADSEVLQHALTLVGIDPATMATISDSILDWRDPDDDPHMAGTESETYENYPLPYFAKNGPIDDLTELLLVRGVTPEMYWGSGASGHVAVLNRSPTQRGNFEEPTYVIGLKDLFCALSSKLMNANTANETTLQVFPPFDLRVAQAIISGPQGRAGPDGVDGTDDDNPFRSAADLMRVPEVQQALSAGPAPNPAVQGQPPQGGQAQPPPGAPGQPPPPGAMQGGAQALSRFFGVRSLVFEVTVDITIAGNKRTYKAMLRRNSARDIQVLNMNWQ